MQHTVQPVALIVRLCVCLINKRTWNIEIKSWLLCARFISMIYDNVTINKISTIGIKRFS